MVISFPLFADDLPPIAYLKNIGTATEKLTRKNKNIMKSIAYRNSFYVPKGWGKVVV